MCHSRIRCGIRAVANFQRSSVSRCGNPSDGDTGDVKEGRWLQPARDRLPHVANWPVRA